MGGSPVVKTFKKAVKKVVKPVVETIKPTSSAPQRRAEVQKKVVSVKKTVPQKTIVSKSKLIRSTRKKRLETSQMTELASVRNQRKKLLGDTRDSLA
jgi:hypothetical protein